LKESFFRQIEASGFLDKILLRLGYLYADYSGYEDGKIELPEDGL